MRFKQGCKMLWLALLAFALDRVTKLWSLRLEGASEAVPGLLNFQPVRNYGAAFGMLAGRNALLIALVLLLCAAIAFALFRYPRMPGLARAGLWLVFAGGLSNLYDRLRYGYVIDFLEFDFIRFPVFNVADICVVAGCALAFIALLRADGGKKHV